MLETLAFLAMLYKALQPIEKSLKSKIKELKSKTDPSIAEKLNIESITQLKDLLNQIQYIPDLFDRVQTPEELLESKKGDCEDFTVLTYSILKYLGYNPGIAIAFNYDDPEAHAFTYFYCPNCNEYYIFSNKDIFTAKSVEEAANILGYSNVIYEKVHNSKLELNKEVI